MLSVKPILELARDGRVVPAGKALGRKRVLPAVMDALAARIPASARRVRFGIMHVAAPHGDQGADPERLDVVAQGGDGARVALHEGDVGGAARDGFQAHAAGAGEQVQDARLGQARHQRVHQRDPHLICRRPCRVATRREVAAGTPMRLGGLVKDGSWIRDGQDNSFVVTDGAEDIAARYTGILPDLFREGQGVVAEGSMGPDGTFIATNVLAKHDENYIPKEVVDALKASGEWRPETATP